MRNLIFGLLAIALLGSSAQAQAPSTQPGKRAEVLVLGTYHMANPGRDVFNVQADDVLSAKRQQEIAELIGVLKKFAPTKIAIESDLGTDKYPKAYAEYLAGKHELTRNEIEQVGFRLAKELGHTAIYPTDADGDFPLLRVSNYAKANGKGAEYEQQMQKSWGEMVKEQGEYLNTHSILQTMLFINSDARVARDMGYYYPLAQYGDPGDYAGPDLLAEWYRRNIRIYNNVMKLVTSPEDRILVIFGSGHLGWLRQDFGGDQSMRLRKLEEFNPATVGSVR